ncbi:MAG: choice-of-anchor D domain-containing protein [Acidobacteria bacterium]|nr:choice-of-anchor D domain-containing protein [Acidobacteriota bacterium]
MINLKSVSLDRKSLRTASTSAIALILATASSAAFAQSLDRISCVTKTYTSAGTDTCRAFLTSTNSDHVYIALSSNNPAVTVPSSIMVSYNAGSKGFYATVASVKTAQTATITAKLNGVSKSFKISIAPPTTSGAAMTINATSIGFGSDVIKTPIAQSVTVTSTGGAALTVNSATVSGTGFSLVSAKLPTTLNPGQSLTLQVQFNPLTAGSFTGQLVIASNASTSTIPLFGTGASHQVELSWNAPTTPVVGYNVYRALSGSTSYSRLNSSLDAISAYTDGTVKSGTGYDYIVRSVNSSGTESSPSNKTSVKIP